MGRARGRNALHRKASVTEGFKMPAELAKRGSGPRHELRGQASRFPLSGGGEYWVDELGDPRKADEFKWLFDYSPYHRLAEGKSYPPLLVLSADADDRVDPMHARKFVAAMQFVQRRSRRPALLRIMKNAGHRGADSRQDRVLEAADELVFLQEELGLGNGFFTSGP
jgi:hypothetical protein